jgi:glutamate racemase
VIGLFDSGLGGLTVVRRVRERLPGADLVFFADQKHVPYGDRSAEDLHGLLQANLAWLDAQGARAIVMACNTSCAVADQLGWPATRAEVLDLLDSASIALQQMRARRIGVVATAATVRSGAYGRRIRNAIPGADVWEAAAPELVPLVEAGKSESAQAREAVARACATLPRDLDAVVYGCTHYPVVGAHFEAVLGPGVVMIDPAITQAERVAALLSGDERSDRPGTTRYVTSGDPERFSASIRAILGEAAPDVRSSFDKLRMTGRAL